VTDNPICQEHGCVMEWEECPLCGGSGDIHDCGDDTCCCLTPCENEQCYECWGRGGFWICPICQDEWGGGYE